MANPNIVNVTSIYGKTATLNLGTGLTSVVTNTAGSGKIIKVNSLYVANKNGTTAYDVNLKMYDSSASNSFFLASTISVPADATLVLISKDAGIYLEEGDYIEASASSADQMHLICSYEEIS